MVIAQRKAHERAYAGYLRLAVGLYAERQKLARPRIHAYKGRYMVTHCSMCKQPLAPEIDVVRCSVSSCNAGRMKMRFCSVGCWEKHVPTARHRSASFQLEATQ